MSAPIDLAVLRVMTQREQWDKVKGYVPTSALDEHTKMVLEDYRKYYDMHPEAENIDMDGFRSLFFGLWHRSLNQESINTYNILLDRCCTPVTAETQAAIVNMLIELELVTEVANDIQEYDAGEEIDVVARMEHRVKVAKEKLEVISTCGYATLETLDEKAESSVEYAWPCNYMNQHWRKVVGGDFLIIAALTDVGKTAFTMMLAVCFSVQTKYPILWFNNEGQKERIQRRAYGMMLGVGSDQIEAWRLDGTLGQRLHQIYGRPDPIRIYDTHRLDSRQLEDLAERVIEAEGGIGGIVWDMLDNVKVKNGGGDARTDQILEAKYQWARELGAIHDFPNLATSQQSANKEWQQWPAASELKDSKVGKQGAADMVLFITKPEEPAKDSFRYISTPKNKLAKDTAPTTRLDMRFDRTTGYMREEQYQPV